MLSPRQSHVVAAELRTHELAVVSAMAMPVPHFEAAPPRLQTVASLPAYLLVRRPPRPAQRTSRRRR
jgi:hypothetical protein